MVTSRINTEIFLFKVVDKHSRLPYNNPVAIVFGPS